MIDEFLNLFNKSGQEYRALIYDPSREEVKPVEKINDINQGGFHNLLEWLSRMSKRYGEEFPLNQATGQLLQEWGDYWGIARPPGTSDSEYRAYIMHFVLAILGSYVRIKTLYEVPGEITIFEHQSVGPYLDNMFFGLGPEHIPAITSTFAYPNNAIYIIYVPDEYNHALTAVLDSIRAAGNGLFQGVSE